MWKTILTKKELEFKTKLDSKLKNKINKSTLKRDEKKLNIQNKAIKKINKLSIEYKYQKATKSMIHDWEKSQASSMIWALKFLWILARG